MQRKSTPAVASFHELIQRGDDALAVARTAIRDLHEHAAVRIGTVRPLPPVPNGEPEDV